MAQAGAKKQKLKKEKQQREVEEISQLGDLNFDLVYEDFTWIQERLGDGSFGMVVPARHKLLGEVAVKFSFRPVDDGLLRKEFRMLARIGLFHPNMVRVYGMVNDPHRRQLSHQPGIVMELVAGGNLHDLIYENRVNYETGHVIGWMTQVLSAIAHLHYNNIIHRDVKPANILLSSDYQQIKLCDFGLTRPEKNLMTPIQGSPYWLAPECLHENYDRKTDVFASGITMWQLLSRKKPHENRTGSILALLHDNPDARPEKLDCDPMLWNLIERSWSTSTEDRLTAVEMLTELRDLAKIYPWPINSFIPLPTSPSDSSVNSSRRNSLGTPNQSLLSQNGGEMDKIVAVSEEILNDLFEKAAMNSPTKLMFEMATQTDDPNEQTLGVIQEKMNGEGIEGLLSDNEQTLRGKTLNWETNEEDQVKGDPNLENSAKDPLGEIEDEEENEENEEKMDTDEEAEFITELEEHWGIKGDDEVRSDSQRSHSRRSFTYNITPETSSAYSIDDLKELEEIHRPSQQELLDELNELRLTCELLKTKVEKYEEIERNQQIEKEREILQEMTNHLSVPLNGGVRVKKRSESGFDEGSFTPTQDLMNPIDIKGLLDRIIHFVTQHDDFQPLDQERLDKIEEILHHIRHTLDDKVREWSKPRAGEGGSTWGWMEILDRLNSISDSLSSLISQKAAFIYSETKKHNKASAERFKAGLLICQHELSHRQLKDVRALLDRETKVMAKQREFHHNEELAEIYDQMVKLLEKISDHQSETSRF